VGLEGVLDSSSSETDMLSELAAIENDVGHALGAPVKSTNQASLLWWELCRASSSDMSSVVCSRYDQGTSAKHDWTSNVL